MAAHSVTNMADVSKATGFLPALGPSFQTLVVLLLLLGFAGPLPTAFAQQSAGPGDADAASAQSGTSGAIHVVVIGPDGGQLGTQAVVKLSSKAEHSANWQTTTASGTTFRGLAQGTYEIEATAVGYLSGHSVVEVASPGATVQAKFVLVRDPSAVSFDVHDAAMPPKASQLMHRGIGALHSGNLNSAEKQLVAADNLAPNNANLKFLLGYVAMQEGTLDQAQTYLTQATTLAPQFGRALILLGRVELMRGEYADATQTLQRAVSADPGNWVAHHLLAHAYLQQHQNEKARQEAEIAISKGGKDGSFAQFVLGMALAQLGKNSEAIAAFISFLQFQPRSAAALDAQRWLALLQQQSGALIDPWMELNAPVAPTIVPLVADIPPVPAKSLANAWQPLGVDESAPPVAVDTTCPLQQVLERVGERTRDFVTDASKFAAIETVSDERLDEMGNITSHAIRKFDYTAAFSQMPTNVVHVDEYRTQRYDVDPDRNAFVDTGFAALTLVFHPAMRDDFQMHCEGLGAWDGRPAWIVHFQQREDRPKRMQTFLVNSVAYPVMMKGRAWISADTFQVVRIESELMHPLPQIQLFAEHEIAEYAPASFPSRQEELWLPKTAEVYLGFRTGRYHRKHSFDHYMLFSVDTEQHVGEAKDQSRESKSNSQVN
jgi:tetratricopeptide (TPR) repeat protein